MRTMQKNNTSGHTGVSWDITRNKWKVSIKVDGKTINLGRFEDLQEAIDARKKYENENKL